MRKTKWAVTFAVVFALGGVAATQVAPVWADSSHSDDPKEKPSGTAHDDGEDPAPIDMSAIVGPCVTAMKTTAKTTGKSGKDEGEDKQEGESEGKSESKKDDDEKPGKGKTQVTGTTDTPCTNRGLSNERRVAWKEIKL